MNASALASFLRESLALWQVEGTAVEEGPACVRVSAPRAIARIERAQAGAPFRWIVRWNDASSGDGAARQRPCGSLVGVLTALRRALGVERAAALRIAPEPDGEADAEPAGAARAPIPAPPRAEAGTSRHGPVPLNVLTGFLGSGKTTLLARLLRHPALARTAVIVNEFGEIGLDHDLIETSDESFVELSTGCLCCKVRSDLVHTLADLAVRRRRGEVPRFERVVIETSGLADPAPILHALMTDRSVVEAYALDGVITTVDALTGLSTLDRHAQSVRQAAVADTLVLTKTDLAHSQPQALLPRLQQLNGDAEVITAVHGEVDPERLFGRRAAGDAGRVRFFAPSHAHADDVGSICLVRADPIHAVTLALFLSALADNCGEDLLRMKGIVQVHERPGRPAAVHGVQHVYHPPQWLPRWPSEDERTRLVFIGRGLRPAWIEGLLAALEAEVAEASTGGLAGA